MKVGATGGSGAARLLVVDDEETILELLAGSLRFAGFEVLTAASGAEALRAAAASRPDLVLLDVMMPDGDGFEVVRRMRSSGPDVPVIFLTARGGVRERVAGLALGGDDYIAKPFSLDEVLERIRAVLRRTGRAAAAARLRVGALELDDDSHELRTPLTSVSGLAEFGLQQGSAAAPGELLRLMTLISREASRMGRLVEDLLMLARFDSGRPLDRRHVDLASIAARAVQAARIRSPGRPVTLAPGDPVIVWADEERLRQVIDNLIGNAVQHTPPRSPVTVAVTAAAGTGEITVADNGPGMTAAQAARVFERFYRTDDARARAGGGTGLGLAIAASLAAAHGGGITVDTQPGKGAAFHVRLPLAAGAEGGT